MSYTRLDEIQNNYDQNLYKECTGAVLKDVGFLLEWLDNFRECYDSESLRDCQRAFIEEVT